MHHRYLFRHLFAALAVLIPAGTAHAQYREHFHERFREHPHSLPPSFAAPEPRRPAFDEHAQAHHRPALGGRVADGPVCDVPDNDPDAAIAACGRIIARGPVRNGYSLVLAYVHRGQAYEDKADHTDAIADFSQAIERDAKVPGYFALRGAAREKAGDTDSARGDFRQAVSLDPKYQDALNGLKRIETRSAVATAAGSVATAAGSVAPPPSAAGGPPSTPVSPPVSDTTRASGTTSAPPAAAAPPDPTASMAPAVTASSAVTAARPPAVAAPVAASSGAAPVATVPPPAAALDAAVGPRVALVIGNGAYVNANALPNPPNDAHAIADVLRTIGFEVVEGENLSRAAMESDLREFLRKAASASIVLLFYAGHGMQVDGRNYLVPVDAKLQEASDLAFETIEIDKVLDALGEPGHTNIILLDACRDNPLARSFASHLPATRSAAVATGLAAYSAVGTGTLIAYATAPGQTALDGQGKDSPFTTSLLHFLPTPGLEIRQMLTRVRAEVAAQTGNRQIPWDNSSLMGDVVLVK